MEQEKQAMQSESIAKLAEALSKAQGKIKGAAKDTANPFFKSKYADLASVWDACRDQLSAHGLSVIQTTEDSPDGATVITTLSHSSGEWIRGRLTLKPVKNDPQGVGSAITYARRYALAAIVGVAPEDDDGEAASGRTTRTPKQTFSVNDGNRDAPPDSWTGPMKKTALKNAITALVKDLKDCTDVSTLQGVWADNKAVVDQAQLDLPDWYDRLEAVLMDRETALTHNPLQAA
jgi:hypothetical protein